MGKDMPKRPGDDELECSACGQRGMRFTHVYGGRGRPKWLCDGCAAKRRGAPRCVRCGRLPAPATFVFIRPEDRTETTHRYCSGCADLLKKGLEDRGVERLPDDPAVN